MIEGLVVSDVAIEKLKDGITTISDKIPNLKLNDRPWNPDGYKKTESIGNNALYDKIPELKLKGITNINADLAGKTHPETGVPYVEKTVDTPEGKETLAFPEFDSSFDAKLPDDLLEGTDKQHFDECNKQLKNWCEENPEKAKKKFSDEQLEQIEAGKNPKGYTWHHHEDTGKMQLVDSSIHAKSAHTGGRAIWGGGSEHR